jgi:hypothetical protein
MPSASALTPAIMSNLIASLPIRCDGALRLPCRAASLVEGRVLPDSREQNRRDEDSFGNEAPAGAKPSRGDD